MVASLLVVFFLSGICVYYRQQWLCFFRQLFLELASNFSTWSSPWQFLPIYSGQYSATSYPVRSHPASVWGRPRLSLPAMSSPSKISLGILPSFIRRTCPSQHSQRWRNIVNIVGSLRLYSTTVFGVMLVQAILSSFLSTLLISICCPGYSFL